MSEAAAQIEPRVERSIAMAPERLATAMAGLPADIQGRVQQAVTRAEMLEQMVGRVLKQDVDYATIPGTPKPTLLQPGAQQLCFVFGLTPKYDVSVEKIDYAAPIPFISYTVKCSLIQRDTSEIVAEGVGACNSLEVRYRYRTEWKTVNGKRVKERTENREVADLQNTILKMAGKRAFVSATLNATAASRLFTQDMEDMAHATDRPTPQERPAAPPAKTEQTRNAPRAEARTATTAKRQPPVADPPAPLDSPKNPETAAQAPLSDPQPRRASVAAMCTAAQREALFASARQAEVADADLRAMIAHRHHVDSTKALTADQASALIADLQGLAQGSVTLDDLLPPQRDDDDPPAPGYVVPQETFDELRGLARDAGISAEELRDTWLARCVDVESTAAVVADLRADAVPF